MLSFYETFQRHNVPDTLKDEVYSSDENRIDIIENFSKVNIFIGPNNSGKSKFIRELIKQKPIPYYGTKNWATIIDIIENIFLTVNKKLSEVFTKSNHFIVSNSTSGMLIDTEELANYKITLFEYIPNYDISNIVTQLEHRFVLIQSAMVQNSSYFLLEKGSSSFGIESSIAQKFIEKFKEIKEYTIPQLEKLKGFRFLLIGEKEMSRIYIPSVRTLRFLGSNVNLKDKTKGEYGFEDVVEIYNGQDFPEEVFKLTNSPFIEKQKLTQFEKLLSKDFFDSKDVKLTFHKEKEVLLIKIGEEIERPIHELGDGLQMLIILTFPFFTNDSGIIAIEEPELFLHPGLQKIFVNFLISNPVTEKFQIFLATHSNHIIDSINQSDLISLFSIRKKEKKVNSTIEKKPDFIIENLAFGNENFLNLLGITNTSVYLSNSTIWVEGITDKIYIRKFISEYLKSVPENSQYSICKTYKEGINYSFALTGGDSIIHWDFSDKNEYYENTKNIIVSKFCAKSFVVVDNDFGKNPLRKERLKELIEDRFLELNVPEIENLLSQEVINGVLLSYPSVKKNVGDEILPTVKKEIFDKKKIGYIIDKLILKKYPLVKKFSLEKKENGSLKSGDKFIFCNKAIEFICKDNLSMDSIKLVEQILSFVISRNNFL